MSIVGKLGGIEGQQTISDVINGSGGSKGILVIRFHDDDDDGIFECDHTLEEIRAAYLNGMRVEAYDQDWDYLSFDGGNIADNSVPDEQPLFAKYRRVDFNYTFVNEENHLDSIDISEATIGDEGVEYYYYVFNVGAGAGPLIG